MKHGVEQNSQHPTLERLTGKPGAFVLYQRKNNQLRNVTAASAQNLHSFYRQY
ncbi:hypothetical protein SAMN05216404_11272 [Nitrosospira multiformis]|uniref:Uncharacterized protein n=1 Tax=Nitrosospira multiformis TaxID=1231 RepID=A0A1H8MB72_9PROT|nr:hypothetical protein SAMN05216404_11272 [Nitrosospira multiformis]